MRNAVQRIGCVQTCDVHQVCDHRACSGFAPCAFTVIQRGTYGIGLHHHGIHRTFYIGNQTLGRYQAWMHTQLNAIGSTLRNTQELDAITQLFGIAYVLCFKLGNAFDIGFVKLHRHAKRNSSHDGGFVRGIHTFNIKRRVCLCITQGLCLFEHIAKGQTFVTHFRQDEVRRAVDDASHPLDAVGTQTFAQCFDDGYATSNSRFKRHHHSFGMCGSKNFCAMHSQ